MQDWSSLSRHMAELTELRVAQMHLIASCKETCQSFPPVSCFQLMLVL